MPTRRTVLRSAAALSAAPLVPGVVFVGEGEQPTAPTAILYDQRHRQSRAFHLRASEWQAPSRVTHDGDITTLWQNELGPIWRVDPVPVAGLTERSALFMLEQLGWQYGLRVLFHAEHERTEAGHWRHRVIRSSGDRLAGQLAAARNTWPAVLADYLVSAPHEVTSSDLTPSGAAMAGQLHEGDRLHSWIIAPRPAVTAA